MIYNTRFKNFNTEINRRRNFNFPPQAIETTHGNIRWNTNQLALPKDGRGMEIISLNSFNQLNKENSPIIAYTPVEATVSNRKSTNIRQIYSTYHI